MEERSISLKSIESVEFEWGYFGPFANEHYSGHHVSSEYVHRNILRTNFLESQIEPFFQYRETRGDLSDYVGRELRFVCFGDNQGTNVFKVYIDFESGDGLIKVTTDGHEEFVFVSYDPSTLSAIVAFVPSVDRFQGRLLSDFEPGILKRIAGLLGWE